MERRAFLTGTGALLLAGPLAADAQPAGTPVKIGVLSSLGPHFVRDSASSAGTREETSLSKCGSRMESSTDSPVSLGSC